MSAPPLVVGTDRAALSTVGARIRSVHLAGAVLLALCLVLVLWPLVRYDQPWWSLAASTLVPVMGSLILWSSYRRLRRIMHDRERVTEVLVVDDVGVTVQPGNGAVTLPWEALTHGEFRRIGRQEALVLRLAPGVTATSHGVRSTAPARYFTVLRRSGLMIGAEGIDTDLHTVAEAVCAHSGGRVTVDA